MPRVSSAAQEHYGPRTVSLRTPRTDLAALLPRARGDPRTMSTAASHMDDVREARTAMSHTEHRQSLERRRLVDRRACPTTLWSALRWQGRRQGFRRSGEGHRAYVDCLAWRTVVLAALVYAGSILDAILTLLHLQDGGSEANPLMHLALAHSTTVFITCKLSMTGGVVWFLAVHQQFPLAARGLYGLALGYGAVLAYHLVLVWRLV